MNRAFLFLLFLLLAGKMCAQQVAGTLTLKEAEQRFLERNLSLIAEQYNIDMAQAQVLQAKSGHFAGTECLQPIEREVF